MDDFKHIKCNIVDDIVTITFDRPKHNVMNIAMIEEINVQLESVLNNDSTKGIVFDAKGHSWCAGVEVSDHKPEIVHNMIMAFGKMFKLIHRIEIPTIAAVHGACLGGGMEMAVACDIVVASRDAVFAQPEIKLGFLPPYAAVRLPELVGRARAIEICTTGKRYKAAEALQIGMISQVADGPNKDSLAASVENYLNEIRACSPLIIRLNKQAIMVHSSVKFDKMFDEVNDFFLKRLMKTEDVLEGIASFEERRKPSWLNR